MNTVFFVSAALDRIFSSFMYSADNDFVLITGCRVCALLCQASCVGIRENRRMNSSKTVRLSQLRCPSGRKHASTLIITGSGLQSRQVRPLRGSEARLMLKLVQR